MTFTEELENSSHDSDLVDLSYALTCSSRSTSFESINSRKEENSSDYIHHIQRVESTLVHSIDAQGQEFLESFQRSSIVPHSKYESFLDMSLDHEDQATACQGSQRNLS